MVDHECVSSWAVTANSNASSHGGFTIMAVDDVNSMVMESDVIVLFDI